MTLKKIYFALTFLLMLIVVGTFVYNLTEGWPYFESAYFSVITLSTVGYGDMYPHTHAGKLFTMFYVLVGVGTVLYTFTLIAENYFEHNMHRFDNAVTRIKNIKFRKDRKKKDPLYEKIDIKIKRHKK